MMTALLRCERLSWPSRAILVTIESRSRDRREPFSLRVRLLRTPHSLASRFCCIAAVIKSSSHPPTTGLEGRWIKGFKAWEDEARHPPIILLWIIGYVNLRVRKMAWKVIEESKKKGWKVMMIRKKTLPLHSKRVRSQAAPRQWASSLHSAS